MGCCQSMSNGSVRVYPFPVGSGTDVRTLPDDVSARSPLRSEPNLHRHQSFSLDALWKDHADTHQGRHSDKTKAKRTRKTVHVYVASIFKDFIQEREFLASHIFPELKVWCSSNNLQLIPVDLRIGLSQSPDTAQFTSTCMQEIARLTENGFPVLVLSLLSEQLGYIPSTEIVSSIDCPEWIDGISRLEMEVAKTSIFMHNPNALILYRDPACISGLPVDIAGRFRAGHPGESERMEILKMKLRLKYPEQVFTYTPETSYSSVTGEVKFKGFKNFFSKVVIEFFILRMKSEFLKDTSAAPTPLECIEAQQLMLLARRTEVPLVGKQQLVDKIKQYIGSPTSQSPLLVLGDQGSGKTTVLAHVATHYRAKHTAAKKEQQLTDIQIAAEQEHTRSETVAKSIEASRRRFSMIGNLLNQKTADSLNTGESILTRIPSGYSRMRLRRASEHVQPRRRSARDEGTVDIPMDSVLSEQDGEFLDLKYPLKRNCNKTDREWQVFYHTVGASPLSHELRYILQRLWGVDGLGEPRLEDPSTDLNRLANTLREMLSTCGSRKLLLVLDGIDRIKGEHPSSILKWIPARLPSNVRIVMSAYSGSEVRKILSSRVPVCAEVTNGSPNLAEAKVLLRTALQQSSVAGSSKLMEVLLNKHGIGNPLYIAELCCELSYQDPSLATSSEWILERAIVLPNDLSGLYGHILSTVERVFGRPCMAALCLLYCSHRGLKEVELLEMLAMLEEDLPDDGTVASDERGWSGSGGEDSGTLAFRRTTSSATSSWSAGTDLSSVCGPTSSANVHKGRTNSGTRKVSPTDLHLPLQGTPLPGSAVKLSPTARLSPWVDRRKISSWSTGSGRTSPHSPTHHHPQQASSLLALHQQPHQAVSTGSNSPLLPSTPDLTKRLSTIDVERPQSQRPSPSISPVSSRLSPIFGSKPPQIDNNEDKVTPSAEIEEASSGSGRNVSAKVLPSENVVPASLRKRMDALKWATLFRTLKHFIRDVGSPSETKWVLKNDLFSKSVYKKYFKNPPTSSFPFNFSVSLCGAQHDRLGHCLRKKRRLDASSRQQSGDSEDMSSELIQRRAQWWHARLTWYFQHAGTDQGRRAEELPFHLLKIQNTSQLVKCLSSVDMFRSLSTSQKCLDLQHYWQCAGGGSACVAAYDQMLAGLEITGAGSQELVTTMKQVALFYQSIGMGDNARQLLLDAVDVAESHLRGRRGPPADLMCHLVRLLSAAHATSLREGGDRQALLEAELRLLKSGGKTAEMLRSAGTEWSQSSVPSLLSLLCGHLTHYAQQGGSAELSARHALEQAREAGEEAAGLFLRQHRPAGAVQALVTLADAYPKASQEQLRALRSAERICTNSFGRTSKTLYEVISSIVEILSCQDCTSAMCSQYTERLCELREQLFSSEVT